MRDYVGEEEPRGGVIAMETDHRQPLSSTATQRQTTLREGGASRDYKKISIVL